MAEVFKAKAFGVEGFERLIAVKRILPSIAEDEEFITMFIDEAKIAVQLQHANIAQIFDLGKVGESYFIALEYVQGRDMRSIADRMRNTKEKIPIPMAVYVTMKVCEGLDYAHNKKDPAGRELNLVHRDVSPQNILISYDGDVKIIDFGIAKAAGKAGKTQAGILKGKFGYMSPEQVRGLPLDRRSDIFAVGICLWEMLTAERLFVGESDFSTLEKVRNVEIIPPSKYNNELSQELEKIVLKTLSKEVEDRYQSAMDLHDDLQKWMYESRSFFSRKDLDVFMGEVFREEIIKEAQALGGTAGLLRSSVPPPGGDPASMPPPPPPKTTKPPTPIGASLAPNKPPPPVPPGQSQSGSRPIPGRGISGQGALSQSQPGARPQIPPPLSIKKTALGVPAPVIKQPSAPPVASDPTRQLATPVSKRNDMATAERVGKPAPGPTPDISMDDWDEDEPPTNIYSKEAAKEMAKASIAMKSTPPPVPSPTTPRRAPAPTQPIPVPESVESVAKRTALPVAVGIMVAVLILVGLVYFLGGENTGIVELFIDPPGLKKLEVTVNGTEKLASNMSPFKKTLEEGNHTFTIKHKGFRDKMFAISVKAGENIRRNITLERISTGFFLETDPPGATVYINDRPHSDKTPVTVDDLEPGTYTVRIVKGESYAPKTLEIDVVAGEINKLPLKELALREVHVTFNTKPWDVKAVLADGVERKELGRTPVTAKLDASKDYKITFSKDGYETLTKKVEFTPGEPKVTIETALARKGPGPSRPRPPRPDVKQPGGNGYLSVQTRPWSKVSIDGRPIKTTPLVNHALRPGSYTVTVENPNFNIKRNYRVKIRPGKTTTLVKSLM
jgi:serine/threonine protein kinase